MVFKFLLNSKINEYVKTAIQNYNEPNCLTKLLCTGEHKSYF